MLLLVIHLPTSSCVKDQSQHITACTQKLSSVPITHAFNLNLSKHKRSLSMHTKTVPFANHTCFNLNLTASVNTKEVCHVSSYTSPFISLSSVPIPYTFDFPLQPSPLLKHLAALLFAALAACINSTHFCRPL